MNAPQTKFRYRKLAVLALLLAIPCFGATSVLPSPVNDERYDFAYQFMTKPLHLGGMGETYPSIASRRALSLVKAHPTLPELQNYATVFEAAFFQAMKPIKSGGLGYLYENEGYYWAKYMADTTPEPAQFDELVKKYRFALSFATRSIQEGGLDYPPNAKTQEWALWKTHEYDNLEDLEFFVRKYHYVFAHLQSEQPPNDSSQIVNPVIRKINDQKLRDRALANIKNYEAIFDAERENQATPFYLTCVLGNLRGKLRKRFGRF